jgi:hypothetical protein
MNQNAEWIEELEGVLDALESCTDGTAHEIILRTKEKRRTRVVHRDKDKECPAPEVKPFVCSVCKDTHKEGDRCCSTCPVPCPQCRNIGQIYCLNTPCSCKCHDHHPAYRSFPIKKTLIPARFDVGEKVMLNQCGVVREGTIIANLLGSDIRSDVFTVVLDGSGHTYSNVDASNLKLVEPRFG